MCYALEEFFGRITARQLREAPHLTRLERLSRYTSQVQRGRVHSGTLSPDSLIVEPTTEDRQHKEHPRCVKPGDLNTRGNAGVHVRPEHPEERDRHRDDTSVEHNDLFENGSLLL